VDQFRGAYQQGLLAEPADYTGAADFGRGILYSPFDLIGAPVDLANMALQPLGLGSEKPFGGSEYLIDKYADLGDYLGVNYQRPTNSTEELLGRIAGGVFAPTGGAATFGRAVDMTTDAAKAYAAGAPARVAERAGGVQLNTGFDPTAPIDNMIMRRMGDNGGPAMQVEAPAAPVRDIDDLGFYSQALEAAQNLPQAKGTGQQIEKMLIKAGVKPDEIAFTPGLRGLLDQPQVTQDEVVGLLEGSRIRPEETILYGGEEGFSGMNFPDRPDELSIYEAYGDITDDIEMVLENDLDQVLNLLELGSPEKYSTKEGGEILSSIRNAFDNNDIDKIDSNILSDIENIAEDIAVERYSLDPVVRLQDPDTGYEIVGSDETGYTIRDDGGNIINQQSNDIPYSLSEARIQAENHAMDRGLVGYAGGETRFASETEDGGTNYREMLLQVPEYEGYADDFTYQGHFDEPNIAVHVRTKDRSTDAGTNDILYVEEMQSDWGQRGRDQGFDNPKDKQKLEEIKKAIEPVQKKLNDAVDERDAFYLNFMNKIAQKVGGVKFTKADLDKDYAKAGLPIKSEDGSELLSRYEMNALMRGTDQVAITADGRELLIDPSNFDGVDISTKMSNQNLSIGNIRKELDDTQGNFRADIPFGPFVGTSSKFAELGVKNLVIKAAQEGKKFVTFSTGKTQADRWNNEGLKTFYDKIIPDAAKKVVKKLDPDAEVGLRRVIERASGMDSPRLTIEITPKMREAIKKGVPLFSAGGLGLLASNEQMSQDRVQPKGIMF